MRCCQIGVVQFNIQYGFEEKEWWDQLDGLYEMFANEEVASYEARAGAHPSM